MLNQVKLFLIPSGGPNDFYSQKPFVRRENVSVKSIIFYFQWRNFQLSIFFFSCMKTSKNIFFRCETKLIHFFNPIYFCIFFSHVKIVFIKKFWGKFLFSWKNALFRRKFALMWNFIFVLKYFSFVKLSRKFITFRKKRFHLFCRLKSVFVEDKPFLLVWNWVKHFFLLWQSEFIIFLWFFFPLEFTHEK